MDDKQRRTDQYVNTQTELLILNKAESQVSLRFRSPTQSERSRQEHRPDTGADLARNQPLQSSEGRLAIRSRETVLSTCHDKDQQDLASETTSSILLPLYETNLIQQPAECARDDITSTNRVNFRVKHNLGACNLPNRGAHESLLVSNAFQRRARYMTLARDDLGNKISRPLVKVSDPSKAIKHKRIGPVFSIPDCASRFLVNGQRLSLVPSKRGPLANARLSKRTLKSLDTISTKDVYASRVQQRIPCPETPITNACSMPLYRKSSLTVVMNDLHPSIMNRSVDIGTQTDNTFTSSRPITIAEPSPQHDTTDQGLMTAGGMTDLLPTSHDSDSIQTAIRTRTPHLLTTLSDVSLVRMPSMGIDESLRVRDSDDMPTHVHQERHNASPTFVSDLSAVPCGWTGSSVMQESLHHRPVLWQHLSPLWGMSNCPSSGVESFAQSLGQSAMYSSRQNQQNEPLSMGQVPTAEEPCNAICRALYSRAMLRWSAVNSNATSVSSTWPTRSARNEPGGYPSNVISGLSDAGSAYTSSQDIQHNGPAELRFCAVPPGFWQPHRRC